MGATLRTDVLTKGPAKASVEHASARYGLAEAGRRNAEVLQAPGMREGLAARWGEVNARYQESQRRTADVAAASERSRKSYAWRCNPPCWAWAPTWSSTSRRRRALSSPARS